VIKKIIQQILLIFKITFTLLFSLPNTIK